MKFLAWLELLLAFCLAPLLLGIINRVKAVFAGRRGRPLLQAYYDLIKLLRRGTIYSHSTTVIFRAAPLVGLAGFMLAAALLPAAGMVRAPLSFAGDLFLFAYLIGLTRFFLVIAALDTGSAFEGMGASREVYFSALAEPALLIGLASLALASGANSLADIAAALSSALWHQLAPAFVLIALAFIVVLLVENSRMPFDDPNTHLELTMIHEVIVLDYSGPDLAFILYGNALKLWIYSALVVHLFLPLTDLVAWPAFVVFHAGIFLLAILIGVIESAMARLSLLKAPNLIIGAAAMAILAFVLTIRFFH